MKLLYPVLLIFSVMVFSAAAGEDSSSVNQKGMDELHADHPDKAKDFFLQAISIDSGQKHYYNNLAAAYIRIGEYLKAEESLKLSLEIDGNYPRALSNMAVALFHLGRYRDAYSYYRLSKKADNDYTGKRFDRKKVSDVIRKSSEEKPDDKELKKIKEYMESD